MKHLFKISFAALLGVALSVSPALSQQAKTDEGNKGKAGQQKKVLELQIPMPFAILDVHTILREAAAVKDIRDQITKYGMKYEKEIEKERNEIRDANQELARQRTILSPEAFAEKRGQFEQRVVEVQRLVQQRQHELDKARNDAMTKVNDVYMKIVGQLAEERRLALIIRKDQTAFSTPAMDVTNDVLARLDKQLPKINVPDPGKSSSADKKDASGNKDAKPGK